MNKKKKLEAWQVQLLKDNYSDHTNAELCQMTGLAYQTMRRRAKEFGLKKNLSKIQSDAMKRVWQGYKMFGVPEAIIAQARKIGGNTKFVKGYNPKEGITEEQWRERCRKNSETKKAIYRAERRRLLFGLPQKTKLRIRNY